MTLKSNFRYCSTKIGCDSKTVGTSPMKSHIARWKLFNDFDEREKQKVFLRTQQWCLCSNKSVAQVSNPVQMLEEVEFCLSRLVSRTNLV